MINFAAASKLFPLHFGTKTNSSPRNRVVGRFTTAISFLSLCYDYLLVMTRPDVYILYEWNLLIWVSMWMVWSLLLSYIFMIHARDITLFVDVVLPPKDEWTMKSTTTTTKKVSKVCTVQMHTSMSYAIDQRIPSLVSLPSIIIQPSIFFVWFFAIYILIDNPNIDSNIYTETETNTK